MNADNTLTTDETLTHNRGLKRRPCITNPDEKTVKLGEADRTE